MINRISIDYKYWKHYWLKKKTKFFYQNFFFNSNRNINYISKKKKYLKVSTSEPHFSGVYVHQATLEYTALGELLTAIQGVRNYVAMGLVFNKTTKLGTNVFVTR